MRSCDLDKVRTASASLYSAHARCLLVIPCASSVPRALTFWRHVLVLFALAKPAGDLLTASTAGENRIVFSSSSKDYECYVVGGWKSAPRPVYASTHFIYRGRTLFWFREIVWRLYLSLSVYGYKNTYEPLIGLKKDSFQVVLRWEYFPKHKYFVRLLRKVWRHVGGVGKGYILKIIPKHYKKGTLLNSLLCNTFTYVITKRFTY